MLLHFPTISSKRSTTTLLSALTVFKRWSSAWSVWEPSRCLVGLHREFLFLHTVFGVVVHLFGDKLWVFVAGLCLAASLYVVQFYASGRSLWVNLAMAIVFFVILRLFDFHGRFQVSFRLFVYLILIVLPERPECLGCVYFIPNAKPTTNSGLEKTSSQTGMYLANTFWTRRAEGFRRISLSKPDVKSFSLQDGGGG